METARTAAIVVARLLFAGAFAMAAAFKFADMNATAGYIASIGFPAPLFFAWAAAFFEVALVIAFLTGLLFSEAAVLATAYVLFLAFAFHGRTAGKATRSSSGFSSTISPSSRACRSQRFTVPAKHWF